MLRPYQEQAVEEIRNAFNSGDRAVLLHLPTGAGKTHIFCHIAQKMLEAGKRTSVITRGRKIVDQASQRLGREGVPHGVHMGHHPLYAPHRQVQVCSITTLYRRLLVPKSDLIIIDEAHYATAPEFHWLARNCGDAKILGVTATPYTSRPLNHIAQRVIAPATVTEIISQGFLVDAKYFAPSEPDLSGVRIRAGDYVETDLEKAMGRTKLIGDIVEHYQKLTPETAALCFCVSVAHAALVAQQFREAGVAACVLHADSPDGERDQAIAELEHGPLRVICNVGVMGTGVDIPWLQTVILARPTKSLNLYLQQIGRGSRPYPEKTHFKVLDHAGNVKAHGFMDEVHPVNLNGHVADEVAPQVKTCKKCFAVFSPKKHSACPCCGLVPEKKEVSLSGQVPESEAGQLVEISRTKGRIVATQESVLEATQRLRYHLETHATMKTASGGPYSPWVSFYKTKAEMIGKIDEDVLVRIFRAQALSMGYSLKRKSV